MPIFITGGTGFLGVNLVRALVSRGERCRLLVRPNSPRIGLDLPEIEFVPGDVTDRDSLRQAMRGCDRVFHLAAWVQATPWGMNEARRVNVEGTRNVAECALETGVRKLVHVSSIATIGCGSIEHPANEASTWNVQGRHLPYYQTKREAEQVIISAVERGLNAVIVNPTYLVGPWDIKPSAGRILIQIITKRLRGFPTRGGINFVDVRRVADGLIRAMDKGCTGRRYVMGGENLSYRAYLERVERVSGIRAFRLPMPYAALFPFAAAGSALGRVFPAAFRDVNLCVLHSAFMEHYVRSDRARDELGFEVTPIDDAIGAAIDWFCEHGYLNASRLKGLRRPAVAD
ncbi:MAG: NAD-dependent epimerase/dehydratase family protein [Planctomycetes bacterium]|nr:NAD-dependent epimerase/dehydratase family protein [Planctomycetota bacterium]